MQAYFITGTDTNVGKTYVSQLLLNRWKQQNFRTLAFKPVASGAVKQNNQWVNEDALILQKAATEHLLYEEINPYCFEPPIAPHIAAQQVKKPIELNALCEHIKPYLAQNDIDYLLIEGAGGLMVPLNEKHSWIDYVREINIPVLVVCAMRLGVLNHAQLTVQTLLQYNIPCAGWIANFSDPDFEYPEENFHTLQRLLSVPCFERIGFSEP